MGPRLNVDLDFLWDNFRMKLLLTFEIFFKKSLKRKDMTSLLFIHKFIKIFLEVAKVIRNYFDV